MQTNVVVCGTATICSTFLSITFVTSHMVDCCSFLRCCFTSVKGSISKKDKLYTHKSTNTNRVCCYGWNIFEIGTKWKSEHILKVEQNEYATWEHHRSDGSGHWMTVKTMDEKTTFPRSLIRYSNDGNLFRISFALVAAVFLWPLSLPILLNPLPLFDNVRQ